MKKIYKSEKIFYAGLLAMAMLAFSAGSSYSQTVMFDPIAVTTLAGSGTAAFADGTGAAAQFSYPYHVSADSAGSLYVADHTNHRIRKIVIATGEVTTLAGSGTAGFADGTGAAAQFNGPLGVGADSAGNLYVGDHYNHRIRKIVIATGAVTTLAGSGTGGFAEGTGAAAQFNYPYGVSADSAGSLYVADHANHRIRKIDIATGAVTTLAGSGTAGWLDATGAAAQFNGPVGVGADSAGNLYVADQLNHRIRKIVIATGAVTTLAGSGTAGFADGTGAAAQFNYPYHLSADSAGSLYAADKSNHRIRKIVIATGAVTTLAGSGTAGFADGTGGTAQFNQPTGVSADSAGNLYVGDYGNHRIRKMTPPVLAGFYTAAGTASAYQSFSVSGNALTADITVTAPTGYEVSLSAGSGYGSTVNLTPSSGSVVTTAVYIRIAASTGAGTYNGNITLDSTGAADKTLAVTGAVFSPPGNALSFNGSNQYVNTAAPVTAQTDNVTIEAWVKWGGGSGQAVVYNGNSANSGYGILIDNPNIFLMCGGVDVASSSVGFTPNVWQHIAAVRRSGTWELYSDGVQKNLSGNTAMNPNTPAGSTLIGSTGSSQYFNGQLDEVRIWNTARTADQIRADMNKTLEGNESGLVAYYRFDRTSGTTLPDLASLGGNNDGTLTNMAGTEWTDSSAFTVWTGTSGTDWNTAGNWSDGIPTATSNVYIPSVTNQPSISGSFSCNHLLIAPSATLTLSSGTLDVKGNIFSSGNISGSGTIVCSGTSAQTVKAASLGSLTLNGSGIILDGNLTINGALTMTAGSITLGTYAISYDTSGTLVYNASAPQTSTDIEFPAASGPANLTINNLNGVILHASRTLSGTLTLTSGDLSIGAHILTLNGGISGSGTLTGGDTSDLLLGGTGNATLPANALTLNNLTLNRSGAVVTLGNDLTVKGTLTLTAGILKVPSYNLLLGESAQIAGTASASAMIVADIIGEVRKTIADGATLPVSFTFPVGSDSGTPEYSPVTLEFTTGTFASAYVGVRLKDLQYPVNNSPVDWLERYWTIGQSGITAFSCDMTFAYVPADIHGTETNIYGKRHADSVWTNLNQAGSNQFTGTVTAFGSFTGADHVPTVASPLADVTVYEDAAPTSITLSSLFSDFDDDNLSVVRTVVSNTNPGLVSAGISGETLTLGYTPNGNGSATVVIRGTANGKYAEDSIAVTVIPVDDAPVVSQKIADVTVSEDAPPTVISLSNVFADIDSASVVKSVLSNSGPGLLGAVIEGDVLTLTYLKDQSSTADIVIRGSADGQYADTAFKVTVNPADDLPVWISEIGDVIVTDGSPDTLISLSGRVRGIDNDETKITFSATGGNASLVSPSVSGTSLTLKYGKDRAGETTVTVTALSGTKTVSDTFTVTVEPMRYAVSGNVQYFSNLLPVPDMKIMLAGTDFYTGNAVSAEIFTDASGNYLFSGIIRGDYTVTPFKNDPPDPKKLSAADADVMVEVALGRKSLAPVQYKSADVTLNGRVSGLDASRLSRFAAGLITEMSNSGPPTPGWISDPESLFFSLNSDISGRDFTMYMTGDVSGNYTPGASETSNREPGRITEITAEQGSVFCIPIVISDGTEFHGIDIDIDYDETVLSAREAALGGGILGYEDYEAAVNLTEPGRIRMAIFGYSGKHITGSGTVVNLYFDITGPVSGTSLLTFTRFDCNEIRVSDGNGERDETVTGGFGADGNVSLSLRIGVIPDDPMKYDADGSGIVDMRDAVQALHEGDPEGAIRALRILTGR